MRTRHRWCGEPFDILPTRWRRAARRHEVPLYRKDAALSVDETCVVGVGDQGVDRGMVDCVGKFRAGEAEVQRD